MTRSAIQQIRQNSRRLVTIGACATAGGIQALRNFADVAEFRAIVYARPEYVETLGSSTAIAAHVPVDFELRGCPIDKAQLLEVIAAFLQHRRPRVSGESVCMECKRRGNICVTVAHGTPCLGPVTHAGCGALCPSYNRGCYGCFGPADTTNTPSLSRRLSELGMPERDIHRVFRTFNAASPEFADGELATPRPSRTNAMTDQGAGSGRELRVDTLARVEGEGAMRVRAARRERGRRAAADL